LFIDEIHRLNRSVEEILYPAMEDYALDIMIGKGPSARSIRLDLPHFTLIGATTRAGLLTAPLRDRFGMINRLELYSPEEIGQILQRDAAILNIGLDASGRVVIAERSRGTPRIAIRLLKRMRDFAQVRGTGVINAEIADFGLKALEIDARGLDATDRRLMRNMVEMFGGGPVGLDDAGRNDRGRSSDDRGRLRAFPDADRIPGQDTARPGADAAGLGTFRTQLSWAIRAQA